MASTAIRQLLLPPVSTSSEERALQFIDSNFTSLEQLGDGDALHRAVQDARQQADELREQLRKSQIDLDERIRDTLSSTRKHVTTAQELSLTRHAIVDELSALTSELVTSLNKEERSKPTLLEELESLHRNLKELEGVRGYVSVLERALRLSETAVAKAQETLASSDFTTSSLTQYRALQSFVSAVASHCSSAENPSQVHPYGPADGSETQPLKLVCFLYSVRDRTWDNIKGILTSKLLETAEKMGWPQTIEYGSITPQDRMAFESEFLDLLKLQEAGNEVHASDPCWKPGGIYPIQALTSPIALRFKFHFEGKRETNRLDKPEWYFTNIINMTYAQRNFMETTIQSLLSRSKDKHIDAFREFTLHLLPLLARKLRYTIPRILQHPSLLAHTIYQALAFDASLREQGFSLERTSAIKDIPAFDEFRTQDGSWEGISEVILGKKEWLEAWLEGERKFADDQYNNIIVSPDAWQIADDADISALDADIRPTNSARRVKALIEQITDRYQPLPRFAARTRFLIAIQIPILEQYHSRISSSLDAFETLSSSFVRAVPGALAGQAGHGNDPRSLTRGIEGVGRLVKAGVSAHYIAVEMERWGEDLFFLELWAEINARAALRAKAEAHPSLPDPSKGPDDTPLQDVEAAVKSTIFHELITQYRALGERAEDMIVRHITSEVESASKPYFSSQWDNTQNATPDERGISIPTTLVTPISLLSSHFSFLVRILPKSSSGAIYRRVASSIATMILQRRLLQRHVGRLSVSEGQQIAEESMLWVQACKYAVGQTVRRIEGPWARLLDAMKLLTLDQDKFRTAVERIFAAHADELEELRDELEVTELDLGDMIDVVRVRQDCWR